MQNNNITFPTLYVYFASKTQLSEEPSLAGHLAGESRTTWHKQVLFLKYFGALESLPRKAVTEGLTT